MNIKPRFASSCKPASPSSSAAGGVVSLDRYLTVDELNDTLSSLELVCTPYPRHIALASIVLRAAAARRPVLATDYGWCARIVPAFQLGWTCNVRDIDEFARAIPTRLEQAADWQRTPAAEQLIKFHAPQNFAATFTARLRERLGQPPLPGTVAWHDLKKLVPDTNR